MKQEEIEQYKKAGKIASQARSFAKSIIKPGVLLLEITEKIENKILELGGKPAFPVNLSINEIAAHYTPNYNDNETARGLLKIDIGVHVNGKIADTAFSLDLENNEENKKLIEAADKAVESALKIAKKDAELCKIGETIQKTIASYNFTPIINLCGHELDSYKVHAGLTIPNCDNNSKTKLRDGAYAIEPFSTKGEGKVHDGKPSGIYMFKERKAIRDALAREILKYIEENYKTLPFASRWIIKKFGTRAVISLSLLEKSGVIHQFPQLIETSRKNVAQSEHTIIIYDNQIEVTTR
ncbi:type II methionyl aminopeptidase [Candidatus Pacearchaeota archaeon]|nr:type II methionyl aminopeptidase [Candidatus Pacearchaeota archaeon]